MDIIFTTTANTDEEARELLRLFGMPFSKFQIIRRIIQNMAKKSMKIKQQMKPKFSSRAYTRCKICGVRMLF
jgi:hypothetical protein